MKVGLTGGIGAGKSTVADLFSKKGAIVIRADELSRQVIEPATSGFASVVSRFGQEIVDENGFISRTKLADIVFKDDLALQDLEKIIHPLVRSKTNEIMSNQTSETIIVNEVPLLLEKNMKDLYDFLVVVVSSQRNRLDRLAKNGLTAEQALSRMAKQIDDETRKNAADFLIVND